MRKQRFVPLLLQNSNLGLLNFPRVFSLVRKGKNARLETFPFLQKGEKVLVLRHFSCCLPMERETGLNPANVLPRARMVKVAVFGRFGFVGAHVRLLRYKRPRKLFVVADCPMDKIEKRRFTRLYAFPKNVLSDRRRSRMMEMVILPV